MMYLIISAVSLAMMLLIYRVSMTHSTYHGFNRFVLLSSLAAAAVIPLVHFNGVGERAVRTASVLLDEITVYAGTPAMKSAPSDVATGGLGLTDILTIVYLAGVAFFLIRIAVGTVKSEIICHGRARTLSDGSRLVLTDKNYAPFSWRNTIVMSRTDYEENGDVIITHEQAHIHLHHSADVMIAQLFCALQWFNPAAWMLKRNLLEVHEFEADAAVLGYGYDSTRYQICLLRCALQTRYSVSSNSFAHCFTKKRIVMIKKTSSNPWVRLRVLLMLPALAFSVVVSSACKLDVEEPEIQSQNVTKVSIVDESGNKASSEVVWDVVKPQTDEEVFMVVEDMPEYPGGTEALLEYLRTNINYPESCKEAGIQGRVLVSFVVEKNGSITGAEIVKSVTDELDAEALRVIKGMPAWKPGKQRGEEVRVKFTVPVSFRLD
jgi:TonB family protein